MPTKVNCVANNCQQVGNHPITILCQTMLLSPQSKMPDDTDQICIWISITKTEINKLNIRMHNLSWLTIVEGDPKAPFATAITPRCRGGPYSFPSTTPLTLDPNILMLSVKQRGIEYHFFESLVWLDLGLNPSLLDHWWT